MEDTFTQKTEGQMHDSLVAALKEVLTAGERDNAPLLIQRIPFICNDIRDIKSDMRWMKWLGSGFVVTAGLLAMKALGL